MRFPFSPVFGRILHLLGMFVLSFFPSSLCHLLQGEKGRVRGGGGRKRVCTWLEDRAELGADSSGTTPPAVIAAPVGRGWAYRELGTHVHNIQVNLV